ncbi:hypothetical protein BDA99DRAFT_595799 [Phascolomyces articulosus]|uniref:Uncharacterized protein n=1 Tax=Phascolomyces articulosus TaxID=60185 RepID=A0AAD5KF52_9FUNG|nr:hypothetical protein BDA99DRAFT_595799 [Phascolomyces articulosus]
MGFILDFMVFPLSKRLDKKQLGTLRDVQHLYNKNEILYIKLFYHPITFKCYKLKNRQHGEREIVLKSPGMDIYWHELDISIIIIHYGISIMSNLSYFNINQSDMKLCYYYTDSEGGIAKTWKGPRANKFTCKCYIITYPYNEQSSMFPSSTLTRQSST